MVENLINPQIAGSILYAKGKPPIEAVINFLSIQDGIPGLLQAMFSSDKKSLQPDEVYRRMMWIYGTPPISPDFVPLKNGAKVYNPLIPWTTVNFIMSATNPRGNKDVKDIKERIRDPSLCFCPQ